MKKKLVSLLVTSALAASLLAGCGSSTDNSTTESTEAAEETAAEETASEETASEEAAEEATEETTSEEATEEKASEEATEETEEAATGETVTLKIAASPTPHAEILEQAASLLAEQGINLEVTEFEDYVQPNNVVESGEFDANYFQHVPYLDSFNEEQGTHLVVAGKIHYEPFGLYAGTRASLDELQEGDVIAVPNDTTNEARALLLLQDNGLIKLKDGADLTATVNDIEENPLNLEIKELEAAQVARVIPEVALVALNGNYAQEAGLTVSTDAIAYETSDSEAAKTYVNVIAVAEGNENNEAVQKLVEVLKSDEIKSWIEETYQGAVIPYDGE